MVEINLQISVRNNNNSFVQCSSLKGKRQKMSTVTMMTCRFFKFSLLCLVHCHTISSINFEGIFVSFWAVKAAAPTNHPSSKTPLDTKELAPNDLTLYPITIRAATIRTLHNTSKFIFCLNLDDQLFSPSLSLLLQSGYRSSCVSAQ
jgi:hypothetical protein